MNSFMNPLLLEMLSNGKFKLTEEFSFHTKDGYTITVPVGFLTDLASVPRVFWFILPPDGKYGKAAVMHDYMYENAIKTKKYADTVFLDAMKALGVGMIKRSIMYWAVRLFGKGKY